MHKWDSVDWIIFSLTMMVCVVVGMAMLKPMIAGEKMSEDSADRITVIVSSVIAIISLYVGNRLRK